MSALTSISSPRRDVDPALTLVDEYLLGRPQADRLRLDLNPACRGERRLGLALAGRVVAVGQQHDPLLGVVREQRRREAQRPADVGRGRHRRRGDPVDLAELRRQPLDERALAERDDPGDVVLGMTFRLSRTNARASSRPVSPTLSDRSTTKTVASRSTGRTSRNPASEDQRRQQQRPDEQRDPAPAFGPPPRARWRPYVSSSAGTRSSSASGASNAKPTSGAPARGPAEARREGPPAADHDVAVVERPLGAKQDEDEQHDRQPQLVAGGRPVRDGRRGDVRGARCG
jgi:hypothetical protein